MGGSVSRILTGLVLAILALAWTAADALGAGLEIEIGRSDPSLSAVMQTGRPLYLEILYGSDVPVRLRVEPLAGGIPSDAGLMSNPSPVYPSGRGSALAWLAFREDARIDRLLVTAYDAEWKRIGSRAFDASLRWSGGVVGQPSDPGWVVRLKEEQRALLEEAAGAADGGPWDILAGGYAMLVAAALPLYLLLQPVALSRLSGSWRRAALLPVVVMVPAAIHAALAFGAGSNLWPVLLILTAPLAVLYLAGLFAAERLAGR